MSKTQTRVLGTYTLAMMTVAAIVSLRNLALTAELGFSAVFFLILAAIIFFIPCALIVAELAAAWPCQGGCYVWVAEAFGKPLGFIALWCSWMANVAWFPTILVFITAMLGHMLHPIIPNLHENQIFMFCGMLSIFWLITLANFVGIQFSGFLSTFGALVGTLIPGGIIIFLGFWWVLSKQPMFLPIENMSFKLLVPDLKLDNLILFAGVLLSLAGVELAAYHVREAKDPQRSYPRAVMLASILILLVYIFGTLAIAVVVPPHELSLASGLIQAFAAFFGKMHWEWVTPLLASFLFIGAAAGINTWIIGPAKGMLVVVQDGFFPPWLRKVNKHGVPTALLTLQAIICSVLVALYMLIKEQNTTIWILTSLSAQFSCLLYIMLFLAATKLRISRSRVDRPFRVKGINMLAWLGIAACVFSFIIVYVPHVYLVSIEYIWFCCLLFGIFTCLLFPTWVLIKYRAWSGIN